MNGTLSEGSGLSGYSNNADCEWVIAPYGAAQIMLHFTEFKTQPIHDVVSIYQCLDASCKQQVLLLAKLSGMYPKVQTITSTTGYMKVVFRSDGSTNAEGFQATWSSVLHETQMFACVSLSRMLGKT